jgi:hypothetical protein
VKIKERMALAPEAWALVLAEEGTEQWDVMDEVARK